MTSKEKVKDKILEYYEQVLLRQQKLNLLSHGTKGGLRVAVFTRGPLLYNKRCPRIKT